ncbi:hypothetical protein P7K49_004383, partial [Saguinus oedipus]
WVAVSGEVEDGRAGTDPGSSPSSHAQQPSLSPQDVQCGEDSPHCLGLSPGDAWRAQSGCSDSSFVAGAQRTISTMCQWDITET